MGEGDDKEIQVDFFRMRPVEKCLLCGENEATKTNSHIVPSFLVAQFASYDGRYKRDKKPMFSISEKVTRTYTGQLPSDKIDETFDKKKLIDDK